MSKGHRRRPVEIPVEEADLRWDVAFAKTDEERNVAIEALAKYFKKKKSSYIEKRVVC